MSSCRCAEISEIEKKLNILYKGKDKMSPFGTKMENTDVSLVATSQNAGEATKSEKVKEHSSVTQALYSDMGTAASTMEREISEKIAELEELLEGLKDEDRRYHEEERRKNELRNQ